MCHEITTVWHYQQSVKPTTMAVACESSPQQPNNFGGSQKPKCKYNNNFNWVALILFMHATISIKVRLVNTDWHQQMERHAGIKTYSQATKVKHDRQTRGWKGSLFFIGMPTKASSPNALPITVAMPAMHLDNFEAITRVQQANSFGSEIHTIG